MVAQSKRISLRYPVDEDWQDIHIFLSDPAVMRWIHLGPTPFTELQTRKWISELIFHNHQLPQLSHNFVVVEDKTQRVIGWIGIGMPSPGKEIFGDLDFGYALAQDKWGKGYMTEALDALLTFAFETLSANRIFAECETHNIGSFRVMEKARMKRDALFTVLEESKEMFRYSIWKDHWLKLANAED